MTEALVDVLDDLVAARRAEVDVDVGHLAARRVEEALEEQLVRDGVGVADAQHVADDAVAGRAAARVVDAAAAGELDDVVHGEEVLGEAELLDDLELALEARRDLGGERPVALRGALEAALAEQRVGGLAGRQRIGGEEEAPEAKIEVAARGDARGVGVGLRVALEEAAHLRRALEVELGVPASQRVGQRLVGGLGGEHVVQAGVGLDRVVHVVGGHGGQAQLVGQQVEGAQRRAESGSSSCCSSMKKSRPNSSWNTEAAARAPALSPASSRDHTSPRRQPLSATRCPPCAASVASRATGGSPGCSRWAALTMRQRLLQPL